MGKPTKRLTLKVPVAGSYFRKCPPCFSDDSKYLITACGFQVIVYNVATGEEVAALSHRDEVFCFAINPFNNCQIYTSDKKSIILWDFVDGVELKRYQEVGICYFIPSRVEEDVIYAYRSVVETKKLFRINLTDASSNHKFQIDKLETFIDMKIPFTNDYIVVLTKTALHTYYIKGNNEKLTYMGYFKSISCHPSERKIAVAQSDGVIRFWDCIPETPYPYEFSFTNIKFQTHDLHWHNRGPTISFSPDGVYLLSGGKEAVLVIWQLATEKKQFLPGLDSTVVHISASSDYKYFCVTTKNNKIIILNANSLSLHQTLSGVCGRLTKHLFKKYGCAEVDPINNCIVTEGSPGVLQFFNMATNRISYALCVTKNPDNAIQDHTPLSTISHFTFSKDKKWLITIDRVSFRRRDVQTLKFWYFSNSTQSYQLNTQIENPHNSRITSLHVSILNDVITTSKDKKFKIWNPVKRDKESLKKTDAKLFGGKRWECRAVGDYKNMYADSASFSSDGSLLAVSFQHIITLWDPSTLTIIKTLPIQHGENFLQICFLTNSHFLVSRTKKRIITWNLLSGSVWWSFSHSDKCRIIPNPFDTNFALYVSNYAKYLEENALKFQQIQKDAVDKIEKAKIEFNIPTSSNTAPSNRVDREKKIKLSKSNESQNSTKSENDFANYHNAVRAIEKQKEREIIQLNIDKKKLTNYLMLFYPKSPKPVSFLLIPSESNQCITFRPYPNSDQQSLVVQNREIIYEYIDRKAIVSTPNKIERVSTPDIGALQEFFKAAKVSQPIGTSISQNKLVFPQASHLLLPIDSTFETFMTSFFNKSSRSTTEESNEPKGQIIHTDTLVEESVKEEDMVVSQDYTSLEKFISAEVPTNMNIKNLKSYSFFNSIINHLAEEESL